MPRRRILSTFTRTAAIAGVVAWLVARRRETLPEAPAPALTSSPAHEESAALAAHDIRSPLTVVVGYSTRLREAVAAGTLAVDEQRAEEILILARAAERLQDGILGMTTLDELDRGTLAVEVEPVRLNRLLQREADRLGRLYPALTVTLDATEEVVVESDERQVRRIVRTLLENAIKHAGDDRPLAVTLRGRPDGGADVTVEDHGPGVPLELRPGLFERQYAIDGQVKHRAGLGLHLAARLAARLGGSVTLGPGVDGATFTLTLPEVSPES